MTKKMNVSSFVERYMSGVENIIFNDNAERSESLSEKTIQELSNHREKISQYLKDEGLSGDISVDTKPKEIRAILNSHYKSENLPTKTDEFIQTIFYKEATLNKSNINSFRKKVDNFRTSQNINILYDLAFVSDDEKNENINNNNQMRRLLTKAFVDLKSKDKAEIFSNLNIFFEKYLEDDVGKKHLQLISDKYTIALEKIEKQTNDKDKNTELKDAANEWFLDVLEVVNASTPIDVSINYENDKVIYNTAGGGAFDGLYFIPAYELNDNQKEEVKNVKTIEELFDVKKDLEHTKQIQISATADKGQSIEKNSIIRHGLANSILATVVNHQNDKDDLLGDLLDTKNVKGVKGGNANLRGYIINSFKENFGEKWVKFDNENPEKTFRAVISKLTDNPLSIINKMIGKKDNSKFSEYDLDSYLGLTKKDSVLKNESFVSLYQSGGSLKERVSIIEDINEKDPNNSLSNLKSYEIDRLFQYSASMRYENTGDKITEVMESNSLSKFVDLTFNLRAYSSKSNLDFDNILLSEKDINSIDLFIFDKFIMADNADANKVFLIGDSKQNISVIIQDVIENQGDEFYINLGCKKEDVINKIEENLNKGGLFPADQRKNVENMIYKNRKQSELIGNIEDLDEDINDLNGDIEDLKKTVIPKKIYQLGDEGYEILEKINKKEKNLSKKIEKRKKLNKESEKTDTRNQENEDKINQIIFNYNKQSSDSDEITTIEKIKQIINDDKFKPNLLNPLNGYIKDLGLYDDSIVNKIYQDRFSEKKDISDIYDNYLPKSLNGKGLSKEAYDIIDSTSMVKSRFDLDRAKEATKLSKSSKKENDDFEGIPSNNRKRSSKFKNGK